MNKLIKALVLTLAISLTFGLINTNLVRAEKCGDTDTNVIGGDICRDVSGSSSDIEKNAIFVLLKSVIKGLSALVGIVAVVMIMVAGVMYTTAGDKDDQVGKAKTMMTNTIIGVILYLFMTIILNFLIPGGIL